MNSDPLLITAKGPRLKMAAFLVVAQRVAEGERGLEERRTKSTCRGSGDGEEHSSEAFYTFDDSLEAVYYKKSKIFNPSCDHV